jgi:hypothetical protein
MGSDQTNNERYPAARSDLDRFVTVGSPMHVVGLEAGRGGRDEGPTADNVTPHQLPRSIAVKAINQQRSIERTRCQTASCGEGVKGGVKGSQWGGAKVVQE